MVPSGAFAKPPVPSSTLTCPVSTWFVESGFVAVWGEIWMFASTNVAAALPEFGATPFVATETASPLNRQRRRTHLQSRRRACSR